jgi:hypothetical protein
VTLTATVLVPTHDHGPTLLRSVPSALRQTVQELEIVVVGDGVPDVTREVMAELTATDERVTFVDHPKGPRHGERYRHEILQRARGEIVCYLSDDDLWLPGHVAQLRHLLAEADFAHALPIWIDIDGRPNQWFVDLARPFYRDELTGGSNRVPLPCAGHTLAFYRRLQEGWRAAPAGTPTDLHMWQQILAAEPRVVSGSKPTVLHFPSPARTEWSLDERLAELDAWAVRLDEPELEAELAAGLLTAAVARATELEAAVSELRGQLAGVDRDRAGLSRRLDALDAQLRQVDTERAELSRQLGARRAGPVLRWAGKARARRAATGAADSPHPDPTREPSSPATGSPAQDRPSDTPARRSDPSTP